MCSLWPSTREVKGICFARSQLAEPDWFCTLHERPGHQETRCWGQQQRWLGPGTCVPTVTLEANIVTRLRPSVRPSGGVRGQGKQLRPSLEPCHSAVGRRKGCDCCELRAGRQGCGASLVAQQWSHLPMQETQEAGILSLGQKILWRRKWQPTQVCLPGKSHGQRSLVGYSPLVAKSWTQLRTHSQGCEWQVPVWVVLVGGGHGWWALLGGKRPHPLTQSQTLRRPTGQK